MNFVDLGDKDYQTVWDLQKTLHEKRVKGTLTNTVLLVEHGHVITMGKSGKAKNVLVSRKMLERKGIAYYEIERGGDVTYHGPGQLVGYPIFNIKEGLVGIKPYIEKLQNVIIDGLAEFGIKGETKEKMIGIWACGGKICSIGVAVKRWVTFHGFALNVNTDLTYFDLVVPCGLNNIKMISMQKILNKLVSMDLVKNAVKKSFGRIFKQEVEDRCLSDII
jgi:lipoate-protein ligase B